MLIEFFSDWLIEISESKSHSIVSNLFATPWTIQSKNYPGQNTGVGCLSLLQGIFPTQGSNPGLPHCRQIFYQLSYQGSPLKCWYSFSMTLQRRVKWYKSCHPSVIVPFMHILFLDGFFFFCSCVYSS